MTGFGRPISRTHFMLANFEKPSDGWLCFFSVLWVVASAGMVVHFAMRGNFFGVGLMGLFGLAAAGLWFQSKIAAWILICFATVGIIGALFSFGKLPTMRLIGRLIFAVWSIFALVGFLKEQRQG